MEEGHWSLANESTCFWYLSALVRRTLLTAIGLTPIDVLFTSAQFQQGLTLKTKLIRSNRSTHLKSSLHLQNRQKGEITMKGRWDEQVVTSSGKLKVCYVSTANSDPTHFRLANRLQ